MSTTATNAPRVSSVSSSRGSSARVQALLLRRFLGNAPGSNKPTASARTAAELWQAAGKRRVEREKAETQRQREEQARRAAAQAAAYAERLDELAAQKE